MIKSRTHSLKRSQSTEKLPSPPPPPPTTTLPSSSETTYTRRKSLSVEFPTSAQLILGEEIIHSSHPQHALSKIDLPDLFKCTGCQEYGAGMRYTCQLCDFQLHEFCALASPNQVLENHPFHHQHDLFFHPKPGEFIVVMYVQSTHMLHSVADHVGVSRSAVRAREVSREITFNRPPATPYARVALHDPRTTSTASLSWLYREKSSTLNYSSTRLSIYLGRVPPNPTIYTEDGGFRKVPMNFRCELHLAAHTIRTFYVSTFEKSEPRSDVIVDLNVFGSCLGSAFTPLSLSYQERPSNCVVNFSVSEMTFP